ncbi:MAG: SulP family inorganic anion transporter [Cyclobacteriaceae bacterium]|nr:SulP family inorganic anion transporter [Cyclobacteriaceae bacterium]
MFNQNTPKTGLAGLKAHWKDDLQAGFSISLIALPLCLGIAIASGFPPIAGLFAAIVGGLIVSRVNGSFVTITGPAAGLIVVNLAAIETLGQGDNVAGYHYALAAIVVAGLIILLFGLLKAGKFGDFFPTSAVHGMLAAIGVIIMVKQIFVALGVRAHGHEIFEVIEEIPTAIINSNPEVALIAVVSLAILIIYPKVKWKIVKMIPAPMWVLIVAIPMELLMDWKMEHEVIFLGEHHKVGPQLLVNLPANVMDGIVTPDFGKIATSAFWIAVMSIALVTAIESLLSAVAVDTLDPFKRKSDLNKDLGAMGIGASVSGLVGGLPMISEIVRSSANVGSGSKTQWSNFFHAIFLLIFMIVLKPIIELIPLSALAAMLIFTGYRLASPKEFKHVYEIGKSELLIFVTTLVMVLATDLLIGIAAGIIMNFIVNIFKGARVGEMFKVSVKESIDNEVATIAVAGACTFSNYLGLKKHLQKNAQRQFLVLDLSQATFLDHTVVHHLHGFERDQKVLGRKFEIINTDHLNPVSEHPMSEISIKAKKLEVNISNRDQELQKLAEQKGWKYNPGSEHTDSWGGFPVFQGSKVNRVHNVISTDINGNKCLIADLIIHEGAQVTKTEKKLTALYLSANGTTLPTFSMKKEQLFDKVLEKAGVDDINFESHPNFSTKNHLTGKDEQAIRKLFNEGMLGYLESHDDYALDCNGHAILVYSKTELNPDGIVNTLEYAKGLARHIEGYTK